jgi:hypothetical protein
MRVPQVSERIKEAPAQALRGVFAGIGQILLITDKLRNKTPASQQVPHARAPEPSETRAAPPAAASPAAASPASASPAAAEAAPAAEPARAAEPAPAAGTVPQDRDPDKTGNVRLLTSEESAANDTAPAAAVTTQNEPGAPLPNYDELSIASLRARLRNLDVAQVRQLAGYEKAHAARPDVMTMFERRIAKLEAETSADEQGEAKAEAEVEAQAEVAADVAADVGAEAEGEE